MAKNPPAGDGRRQGAVRDRSQVFNTKTEHWVKRDSDTGRFVDQKADDKPFKSVCERVRGPATVGERTNPC